MQATTQSLISRNNFGALTQMPAELSAIAKTLLNKAIVGKKLTAPYNAMEWDKRRGYLGWCLNYDFYDINESTVLVQQRETERTKYGSSPRKEYYLIRRCGRGVTVTEAPKARVVKLAKMATELGQVIATLTGKAKKPLTQTAPFTEKTVAYKIVEQRDGKLFSVYDEDFVWHVGKARIEASSDDHTGGFYVFPTIEAAKDALAKNVVFNTSWQAGKKLVLVECETAGREHRHDNGKVCVTFCRPTRVLEELSA